MKTLMTIALLLAPGLLFAQTNCRSVELPDHLEAVCIGDEKAIPAPDTSSTSAVQRVETTPQATPEQMQTSTPAGATPQAQSAATSTSSPQTSTTQASPSSVVHRQGRQQYQKGMDEAKAARRQLINKLQQSEPAP